MQRLQTTAAAKTLAAMVGGASIGYAFGRTKQRSNDDADDEAVAFRTPFGSMTAHAACKVELSREESSSKAASATTTTEPHSPPEADGQDEASEDLDAEEKQAEHPSSDTEALVDEESTSSSESAEIDVQGTTEDETLVFQIDSLVLAECYHSIFATPEVETIVYLTGMRVDQNMVTINRMVDLDHETQSAVRAAGDPDASFGKLIELDQCGHQLLGHCHNHPGSKNGHLMPSNVDHDFQGRLESGGYTTLGLIMSEDGYVRLYTNELDFEVRVVGNHVEKRDDDLLFLKKEARKPNLLAE